jgi:hypothetical protein
VQKYAFVSLRQIKYQLTSCGGVFLGNYFVIGNGFRWNRELTFEYRRIKTN